MAYQDDNPQGGAALAEAPLEPLTAERLSYLGGVRHGFFTRLGGVSKGIYASLNCGLGSMDIRDHVYENRRRAAAWLGVEPARLLTAQQSHSATAVAVSGPWDNATRPPAADAIVTRTPGVAVAVLAADCVPVLLADAEAGVAGAAHSGWKGARAGIVSSVVAAMVELGARPERIVAAIGPAISQASYEVGPDFREALLTDTPQAEQYFSDVPGQLRPHFDLPGFVKSQLQNSGVTAVEDLEVCTYQNESLLFSYRRSTHRGEPDYGRQISAILLS